MNSDERLVELFDEITRLEQELDKANEHVIELKKDKAELETGVAFWRDKYYAAKNSSFLGLQF